jgi:hypothetical protein
MAATRRHDFSPLAIICQRPSGNVDMTFSTIGWIVISQQQSFCRLGKVANEPRK